MPSRKLAVVGHVGPGGAGMAPTGPDEMSAAQALSALAALGQPTRLAVFQLLMRHEGEGLPAGAIADAIGCPQNTLSAHLSILARAGLIVGRRDGRLIVYRASVECTRSLIEFLVNDCCHGHPELCALSASASESDGSCCNDGAKAGKRAK